MNIEKVRADALRYIGMGKAKPDAQTLTLLDRALDELSKTEKTAPPKHCAVVREKKDIAYLLLGNDIAAHLDGCERVIFFAATLGNGADRIIRTAQIENMAYALILDAAASAFIEDCCDETEKALTSDKSFSYTWRFSPGYGDYPLSVQPELIRFLNADKLIGVTVTESGILLPRKSVTAVIGISDKDPAAEGKEKARGCESCTLKETCSFRKENKSCGGR